MPPSRCAAAIHELVSPPSYGDEDQGRTRAAVAEAYARWQRQEDGRPANRLKDLLGIDRNVSLRFWRRWLSCLVPGERNRFSFLEPQPDPEMIERLHRRYDRLLGDLHIAGANGHDTRSVAEKRVGV